MQSNQNRAIFWALLAMLMIAFTMGGSRAYAETPSKSKIQKTSTNKTSATAQKNVRQKKAEATARHNTKTTTRQRVNSKTAIAPRKNLKKNNAAAHANAPKVQVALRNSQPNDIVVRRNIAPLTLDPAQNTAGLRSEIAFVQDLKTSTVLYDQNGDEARPIASISKLMTALIVAESGLSMSQMLRISDDDVDRVRYSRSRLPVGTELSRADMLHLALMSSENRTANALGRYYPGGMPAFVRAMNDKARSLGMRKTRFVEPTGLSEENVSSPRDLVKLLRAVSKQPLIHRYTTDDKYEVELKNGRQLVYNNTNRLVKNADWDIQVSKTGYINEAGECLVMVARIDERDVAIVLLNSTGRYSRIGDAVRVRNHVQNTVDLAML